MVANPVISLPTLNSKMKKKQQNNRMGEGNVIKWVSRNQETRFLSMPIRKFSRDVKKFRDQCPVRGI